MRASLLALLACLAAAMPAALAAACDGLPQAACLSAAPACAWCVSVAVPAACYTAADAARLPPGVFACKKEQAVLSVS